MKNIKLYPATRVAEDLYQKNNFVDIRMRKLMHGAGLHNAPRKSPRWRRITEVSSINQLIFASFLNKSLPCIDKNGLLLPIPTTPSEFSQFYVCKSDVNKLLQSSGYRLEWKPKNKRASRKKLTQDVNWKHLVHIEATALCIRLYRSGANPSRSDLAKNLELWCSKNNIKTDSGNFPSNGYLRTHILGSREWRFPPKP
jgi:hypothetical protein